MTFRALFTILLKIIGIFFIRDILATIPSVFSVLMYFSEQQTFIEGVYILFINLLILSIYILLFYYCVFKTDILIDKLKLDEGTHLETIPFNIHRSTILSISIIVIGGLFLAEEIPNLCQELFTYYKNSHENRNDKIAEDVSYVILEIAKVTIGFILVKNHRQLVNYIEKARKE